MDKATARARFLTRMCAENEKKNEKKNMLAHIRARMVCVPELSQGGNEGCEEARMLRNENRDRLGYWDYLLSVCWMASVCYKLFDKTDPPLGYRGKV